MVKLTEHNLGYKCHATIIMFIHYDKLLAIAHITYSCSNDQYVLFVEILFILETDPVPGITLFCIGGKLTSVRDVLISRLF